MHRLRMTPAGVSPQRPGEIQDTARLCPSIAAELRCRRRCVLTLRASPVARSAAEGPASAPTADPPEQPQGTTGSRGVERAGDLVPLRGRVMGEECASSMGCAPMISQFEPPPHYEWLLNGRLGEWCGQMMLMTADRPSSAGAGAEPAGGKGERGVRLVRSGTPRSQGRLDMPRDSHPSPHLLTSPHRTPPHLTPPHPTPTPPHLTSPHLTSPHPTSPHLTPPHLTSPHPTSPHLTSPHPTFLRDACGTPNPQAQRQPPPRAHLFVWLLALTVVPRC